VIPLRERPRDWLFVVPLLLGYRMRRPRPFS